MEWASLYCPNWCVVFMVYLLTKVGLVRNGTSKGYKQALCQAWGSSGTLRYGTAYFGLEADPLIFETAVRALAEGNSLRATARIVQVNKNTTGDWLNRASQQCRQVMLYFWHNLHVTEC